MSRREEHRFRSAGPRGVSLMDSGIACELDPAGANEVNFRQVERAVDYKWGAAAQTIGLDEESDASDASDEAPRPETTTNRSGRANEYDLDDDFIDDDDLYKEKDDVRIRAVAHDLDANDDTPLLFERDAEIRRDQPLPIVRQLNPDFYVNRGEIRARDKIEQLMRKARARTHAVAAAASGTRLTSAYNASNGTSLRNPKTKDMTAPADEVKAVTPQPKSSAAAAKKDGTKAKKAVSPAAGGNGEKTNAETKASSSAKAADSKAKSATETKGKATTSKAKTTPKSGTAKSNRASASDGKTLPAKRPLKQQAFTATGKLSKSTSNATPTGPVSAASAVAAAVAGESAVKKRKTESAPKPLPPSLLREVDKLKQLCTELFGEKKPNLLDPTIQQQVKAMFDEATKHKLTQMVSDGTQNRHIKLPDELSSEMAKFLRTTRPYLEQLGFALHWKAIEDEKTADVMAAQAAVAEAAKAGDTGVLLSGLGTEGFDARLDGAMCQYLNARTRLLEAKNQLAKRPNTKTVRKLYPGWATALKKGAFGDVDTVTDAQLLEGIRKVDGRIVAETKRKKEEEKEARRKKREEKAAQPKQDTALPPALRKLASLKAKAPSTKPAARKSTGKKTNTKSVKESENKSAKNGKAATGAASTAAGEGGTANASGAKPKGGGKTMGTTAKKVRAQKAVDTELPTSSVAQSITPVEMNGTGLVATAAVGSGPITVSALVGPSPSTGPSVGGVFEPSAAASMTRHNGGMGDIGVSEGLNGNLMMQFATPTSTTGLVERNGIQAMVTMQPAMGNGMMAGAAVGGTTHTRHNTQQLLPSAQTLLAGAGPAQHAGGVPALHLAAAVGHPVGAAPPSHNSVASRPSGSDVIELD